MQTLNIGEITIDITEFAVHETPEYVKERIEKALKEVLHRTPKEKNNILESLLLDVAKLKKEGRGFETNTEGITFNEIDFTELEVEEGNFGSNLEMTGLNNVDFPVLRSKLLEKITNLQVEGSWDSMLNNAEISLLKLLETHSALKEVYLELVKEIETKNDLKILKQELLNAINLNMALSSISGAPIIDNNLKEVLLSDSTLQDLLVLNPGLLELYYTIKGGTALETKTIDLSKLRSKLSDTINEKYLAKDLKDIKKRDEKQDYKYWENVKRLLGDMDVALLDIFKEHQSLFLILETAEFNDFSGLTKSKGFSTVYIAFKSSDLYTIPKSSDVYAHMTTLRKGVGAPVKSIKVDKENQFYTPKIDFVFTVVSYYDDNGKITITKDQKEKVNWIIYNAEGDILRFYLDKGEILTKTFGTPGTYIVEAYGSYPDFKNSKDSDPNKLKSCVVIIIKRPELDKIIFKGRTDEKVRIRPNESLTFEAVADVGDIADVPAITWKLYYKITFDDKYQEKELVSKENTGISITECFKDKGYYKLEACSGEGDNKKVKSIDFSVGGNWVTSITENKGINQIYKNTNGSFQFKVSGYKISPANTEEINSVKWIVYKNGEVCAPPGVTLQYEDEKNKKKPFISKGDSFDFVINEEGEFAIEAYMMKTAKNKKKESSTLKIVNVLYPEVTKAIWTDENKEMKVESGVGAVNNYICGSITHFAKRSIDIEIYDGSTLVYTKKKATITDESGNFMLCLRMDKVLNDVTKIPTCISFKIKGTGYALKNQDKVLSSELQLSKKAAIKRAYFMFGNQELSPYLHAVPYGTCINFVVETTNMVGQKLELELYKAKDPKSYSWSGSSFRDKIVQVNTDGKAIVEFELQTDWANNHETHKYFYVGAESDTWKSYFTSEHDSSMLLAYKEGDVLESGVRIVRIKDDKISDGDGVDYDKIAKKLGIDSNVAKAITKVESSGSGFYEKGGVKIRFEGHQFKKHLKLKGVNIKSLLEKGYDDIIYNYSEINNKKHGLKQYQRALEVNPECAMMATSYGAFQIMGFNYESAGYSSVEEFVKDQKTYNGQVKAFLNYVSTEKVLLQAMKEKDFTKFAKHYNGPDYEVNQYDVKMKKYFKEFSESDFNTNNNISSSFNVTKAVSALNKNKKPKPIGKCAMYVRFALEAGNINTKGHPEAAADYVTFLPKKGFKEAGVTDEKNYSPKKGDIAVFERFQGKKKYHKWGHIQMFNGEKWVSDFEQRDFWAGPDYRESKPNFKIFR